jgi:hypothetical protein
VTGADHGHTCNNADVKSRNKDSGVKPGSNLDAERQAPATSICLMRWTSCCLAAAVLQTVAQVPPWPVPCADNPSNHPYYVAAQFHPEYKSR